ncbi:hypothetical protein L0Y34_00665 [Candidatus Parcubacteria bacterium]|nr:hypothetical protein [Candidatus Parcubacteria bacterium]
MADYRLVMAAYVSVRDGERLIFTPGIGGLTIEGSLGTTFCEMYECKECTLVKAEMPKKPEVPSGDPAFRIACRMNELADWKFTVRFEDGCEQKLGARHFTLPPNRV